MNTVVNLPDFTFGAGASLGTPANYAAASSAAGVDVAPSAELAYRASAVSGSVAAAAAAVHGATVVVSESRCPFARLKRFLFSARQVDARNHAGRACPAQMLTLSWIRDFVVKPHPELGRPGPVCPFLPRALREDSVTLRTIDGSELAEAQLDVMIKEHAQLFLVTEPTRGNARLNKTIVLVFSGLPEEHAGEIIEAAHRRLKPHFVELGLMLGEFHKGHQGSGVKNEGFRPLQSPVPLLVIRYMVASDIAFLERDSDPYDLRKRFVQAYKRIFKQVS